MKTNYHLRSRAKRHKDTKKHIFTALAVLLIGAGLLSVFGGALRGAFAPLWKSETVLARGAGNLLDWFSSKDSLVRENTALRELLAAKEVELVSLRNLKEREASLFEMLGRDQGADVVLAAVLVRPPKTPYDVLVVDAGSEHSVEVGDEVVLPEGPALGIVSEVDSKTSRVRLYSSDGEEVSAVLERHSIPVVLSGQGGGNFRVTLPRDVEVEEGDRILSAGVSSELVAVVGQINMTPTDSFKEVLARGSSNIFTLRYVLIKR